MKKSIVSVDPRLLMLVAAVAAGAALFLLPALGAERHGQLATVAAIASRPSGSRPAPAAGASCRGRRMPPRDGSFHVLPWEGS